VLISVEVSLLACLNGFAYPPQIHFNVDGDVQHELEMVPLPMSASTNEAARVRG